MLWLSVEVFVFVFIIFLIEKSCCQQILYTKTENMYVFGSFYLVENIWFGTTSLSGHRCHLDHIVLMI